MRAKVNQSPIIVDDLRIGMAMEIEYEEGEPEFGRCVALDCPEIATEETLSGLHFCEKHFLGFYSEEPFGIDRMREFADA